MRSWSDILGPFKAIGKGHGWRDILGLNARTLLVDRENSPRAIQFVNDKQATKNVLSEVGVPVPPTIELIRDRRELGELDWGELPDSWVLKPDMGRQGAGLLIADERDESGDGWLKNDGSLLTRSDLTAHIRHVLDGDTPSRSR